MTNLTQVLARAFLPDSNTYILEEYPAELVGFEPTPLEFHGRDPSCFYPYEAGVAFRGQDSAKERLDIKIQALDLTDRFKCLLTGPAGSGKTTLARVIAKRIRDRREVLGAAGSRYFEILPAQIESKDQLDFFMRGLQVGDIIFVDEIHVLKDAVGVEPLYHTLDDTGLPKYPLSAGQWLEVPLAVSWIAATTEPGELDTTTGGALRRRLSPEIRIEPPDKHVLVQILRDQDFPIDLGPASEIAQRSGGLPWQALEIYREAKDYARSNKLARITEVARVFELLGIDERGLTREDRSVIAALLKTPHKLVNGEIRYKMSETALCAVAGIDSNTYKKIVQPRLMRTGMLTIRGGQCLTEKALREYHHLR